MPSEYIPLFIFAIVVGSTPIAVSLLLRRRRKRNDDSLPAEIGEKPEDFERAPDWSGLDSPVLDSPVLDSKRIQTATVLFVIFDAAIIFLLVWAIDFNHLGAYGLLTIVIFLGILSGGYVWVRQQGLLVGDSRDVEAVVNDFSDGSSS